MLLMSDKIIIRSNHQHFFIILFIRSYHYLSIFLTLLLLKVSDNGVTHNSGLRDAL
jgi:hypothetical protein